VTAWLIEGPKLLAFLFFFALGALVMRSAGDERRRTVSLFILFVLGVSGLAGVTQWDVWPFTNNMLATGRGTDESHERWLAFYGVDSSGREWRLDPYTWSPVFDSVMQTWISMRYDELSRAQQEEVQHFLLTRANETREALAAGHRIGYEKYLDALGCPYWWRLKRWKDVPHEPYRAVRVYRMDFQVGAMVRGDHRVTRTLFMECRQ